MIHPLPEGLVIHCEKCDLVIPADAPRPEGGDCAFVSLHRLACFRPQETVAGQHAMATAAWSLIYHDVLSSKTHPESVEYMCQFKKERKAHFHSSAVKKALSEEQIELGSVHLRDWKLYADKLDFEKRQRLLKENPSCR
jgi:hypothetical protein